MIDTQMRVTSDLRAPTAVPEARAPASSDFKDILAAYSDRTVSGVDDKYRENGPVPAENRLPEPEDSKKPEKPEQIDESAGNEQEKSGQNPDAAIIASLNAGANAVTEEAAPSSLINQAESAPEEKARGAESLGKENLAAIKGEETQNREEKPVLPKEAAVKKVEEPGAGKKSPEPDEGKASRTDKNVVRAEAAAAKEEAPKAADTQKEVSSAKETAVKEKSGAEDGGEIAALPEKSGRTQNGGTDSGAAFGEREDRKGTVARADKSGKREKAVKFEARELKADTGGGSEEVSRRAVTSSGKDVEIVVEIKGAPQNYGHSSFEAGTRETAASGQFRAEHSTENMLARELHQNLNGDIVRQANIMLRENGSGTIRLALHPASLGNVKIRLELADNKISGNILVESEEALRAFEREISSLEEAFRAQGFDGAALNTALSGGGGAEMPDARRRKRSVRWEPALRRRVTTKRPIPPPEP